MGECSVEYVRVFGLMCLCVSFVICCVSLSGGCVCACLYERVCCCLMCLCRLFASCCVMLHVLLLC